MVTIPAREACVTVAGIRIRFITSVKGTETSTPAVEIAIAVHTGQSGRLRSSNLAASPITSGTKMRNA